MSDIRVCKVLNKIEESKSEDLVVCSMWEDTKLQVYVVKDNSTMLFGKLVKEQLEQYARTFDKTLHAYILETKDIFSGAKDDVDFFLTDSKFYWKRKKRPLGTIDVEPAQDIKCLTSVLMTLIEEYAKNKRTLDGIQKDYQNIKIMNSEIVCKLNEFQHIKEQLEDGLYKKFALILNSKKAKIKDLRDQLRKLQNTKTIFTEVTDESDCEVEEENHISSHLNQKRCHRENVQKEITKRKKPNETSHINTIEENCSKNDASVNVEPIPSTSTNNNSQNENEETPDLLSEESECDLELKFDEDKLEDSKCKKSAITEEDSQEEMF